MKPPARRRRLFHGVPDWVENGSLFFITLNCRKRCFNSLAVDGVGNAIIESVRHYHTQGIWFVRLVLVMPDHMHSILSVSPDRHLETTVRSWKSYQAKTLNVEWQQGFFDHRIRQDESLEAKLEYIRNNPVRAGLVADFRSWPYLWECDGSAGTPRPPH